MANFYSKQKKEVLLPKQKTIDFILNYSKSIDKLKLNQLLPIAVPSVH